MAEAMKMVKADLGPNAVILHTRDLGKGLVGFFMGRGVEVTAAVDPKDDPALQRKAPAMPSSSLPGTRTLGKSVDFQVGSAAAESEGNPLLVLSQKLEEEKRLEKKRQEMAQSLQNIPGMPNLFNKPAAPPKPETMETAPALKPEPTQREKRLEERLEKMESQLTHLSGLLETITPALVSGSLSPVPSRTRELYNHLLEQDVDEKLALSIANHIHETTGEKDEIWATLQSWLLSQLPVAPPAQLDPDAPSPKLIMLVGPTGVGKTTTLAKISAQYRYNPKLEIKPKISFITADLYRLAAVEQLQKYSEILGVELEVTYSPEEVKQALAKHQQDHLLLFDTAGCCQRNMPQMSTLASIVEACEDPEVHLVLSTTTKYNDMVDIIEHFKEIKPARIIFSKIDESTTYGAILNILIKYKIPISYLTTGQNVPEDIEIARPERIAKLLMQKPLLPRAETRGSAVLPPAVEKKRNEAASTAIGAADLSESSRSMETNDETHS